MPKINVLPREVAELIAAGEVIERPASIVKELVENAIDAGSTAVTVEIQHGGVKYLRVTDNGCGIEREDAPKAFMRHATSKVRDASDLDSIGTLGFRGEALASIAAVAHVEMMTKVRGAAAGTLVQVSGSEVTGVSDAGCPDGTTIVVRDVFYNVPAPAQVPQKGRDRVGGGGLDRRQDRPLPPGNLLLLHPGRQAGLPHPRQWRPDVGAVYTVLGRDFAKGMLPVDYSSGGVRVSGFICRPAAARSNRSMEHFFVNGRYTRTRTCGVALEEGYRGALMVGKFPSCVLMLSMPCELVDVNVHPAKIEVRFQSEKAVFDAVYFAVKSTLLKDGELAPKPASHNTASPVTSPFAGRTEGEQVPLPKRDAPAFAEMPAAEFKARFQPEKKPEEMPGAKVQLREEWLPPKRREVSLDVEPDPQDFPDLPGRPEEKRKAAETKLPPEPEEEEQPVLPAFGKEKLASPVAYRVGTAAEPALDVEFDEEADGGPEAE